MAESEWAVLKEYASRLEADLDLATLETENVPTIVRGPEVGIFGPGFSGSTSLGVSVFVPAAMLDFARELIGREPAGE